jgi:glycosyltransferase involved in cell wall biosynthesis
MSKVDIVVPCYNYGRFLETCVSSVLCQESVDVRILIIDDASSDNTNEVAQRLAGDPRVEYRRHEVNQGHIATYNEGLLSWASARYCLLISADDALAPGALARATQLMDWHEEVGFVYGMALVIGEHAPLSSVGPNSNEYRIIPSSDFLRYCFLHHNPVPTPTAVVRTALQRSVGGYRSDLPHTGDMEMWMRLSVHAPVAVLRSVQAYYRWHAGNMSIKYYNNILGDAREMFHACDIIFTGFHTKFPESYTWMNLARKRISNIAIRSAGQALNRGDLDARRSLIAYAQSVYPAVWRLGSWWRLRSKLLFGKAGWRRVSTILNRVRGVRDTEWTNADRIGAQDGWWPDIDRGRLQ